MRSKHLTVTVTETQNSPEQVGHENNNYKYYCYYYNKYMR